MKLVRALSMSVQDVSKAVRASIDWAMRLEKEGNSKDLDLFEEVRCLNC
eukprot:COSAG01_NODE_9237_length_2510_cov_7.014102_2_plen_49_part_00